jgi:hypothetical protein
MAEGINDRNTLVGQVRAWTFRDTFRSFQPFKPLMTPAFRDGTAPENIAGASPEVLKVATTDDAYKN